MKLVPVEKAPVRKANCQYKNLREYLNRFMTMPAKYVHVQFDSSEFANVYSAYGSFFRMINLFSFPVKATIINGELYLIKTNMED